MERDRVLLIQKTFRTLNTYYYRNQNLASSSSSIPPLAVQRVKVTFKDEFGEGSGVARSFYASIVEVNYSLLENLILIISLLFRLFYLKKNYPILIWVLMEHHQRLNLYQVHYLLHMLNNNVYLANDVQH